MSLVECKKKEARVDVQSRIDADGKTDWQMSEDDAPRGARDAKEQEDE